MAETGEGSRPDDGSPPVAQQARGLLRAARAGSLATLTEFEGTAQPFVSLVTPACAPDLALLLFLSTLSEHTRHLRATPRCALMVQGAAAGTNPQMTPRLTVTGRAEPCDDATLKARWLAIHPYAALYASFTDFSLWRIVPESASLVGGFARAYRLGAARLLPDPAAVQAISAAEADIIGHCNRDHATAIDLIAQRKGGFADAGWRMVAVDCDGCDLACEEVVWRCDWPMPVADPNGVRNALVQLVTQMRAQQV